MQVNLHSGAWHRRLQLWTFGDLQRFENLCPYFWITVFCILTSPFVGAMKAGLSLTTQAMDVGVLLLSYLLTPFEHFSQWLGNRFDPDKAWRIKHFVKNMPDGALFYYWNLVEKMEKKRIQYNGDTFWFSDYELHAEKILNAWKAFFPNWENILPGIIAQQKELFEEKLKAAQKVNLLAESRKLARRAFFLKLADYTQTVMRPVGWGLAVSLFLGVVGWTGYWIYIAFTLHLMATLTILGWIGVGGIVLALAFLVVYWMSKKDFLGIPTLAEKIWDAGCEVVLFCATPIGFILKPFGLFLLYAKAVLDNNCPAIDWED